MAIVALILSLIALVWVSSILGGIFFSILMPAIIWMISGYLAGQIMRGEGYGPMGNLLLGLVGGIVGSTVFWMLRVSIWNNFLGAILLGTFGAIIVVWVSRMVGNDKAKLNL